ncbi:MAG: helix-turn-helix domain-containing protein [Lachnospiraceae bacterium]|nr:helix-turn-helix domain-containing protein [Lachnospiraceae bacterium]
MMLCKTQISEKLQRILTERDLSICRFSKITGLDKAVLLRIIHGQCLPKPCTVKCICHALEIRVSDFLETAPCTSEKNQTALQEKDRTILPETDQTILPKTDRTMLSETDRDIHLCIKKRLKEKNWSLYRLTKEARLSKNTLYNSIKRNNIPDYKTLLRICEALEIAPAQILDFYI